MSNFKSSWKKKTAVFMGLISKWFSLDPESAVLWANRLKNPKDRVEYLIISLKIWHRHDPDKVEACLEDSGLPAELKGLIKNPPNDESDTSDEIA